MTNWIWFLLMTATLFAEAQPKHRKSASEVYIDRQLRIIEQHKKELIKLGHINDPEHFQAELYMAEYSWHSACGNTQFCDGGSFGAYTFSERAFEQAKRIYVIHGEMEAGSDILKDAAYGECIPEEGGGCIIGSSSGYVSPRNKGVFDQSVVGLSVGSLTYCMKYGVHYEHCDGPLFGDQNRTVPSKIIRFIDGGHVQLDHKAKYDAEMYGMVIVPLDYVDLCACTTPVFHEEEAKPSKPCKQGGTLEPGESCSIGITLQ